MCNPAVCGVTPPRTARRRGSKVPKDRGAALSLFGVVDRLVGEFEMCIRDRYGPVLDGRQRYDRRGGLAYIMKLQNNGTIVLVVSGTVSYTHLDVYKRQKLFSNSHF